MNLEKLNMLALTYQVEKNDEAFTELYKEAQAIFAIVNRAMIIRSGYGDESDADELFDKAIFKLSERPDVRNFGKTLSSSLKNARTNFIRDAKLARSRIERYIDAATPDAPTFEIVADIDIENEVIRKKEADQRQLIDSLVCDPRQVDPTTKLIVEEFPRYESITALAKALGLHHEVVKRKLRKLSHFYDANRFGEDVRDYLAV